MAQAWRKRHERDMTDLRDASARELDELFRQTTVVAAQVALRAGLPITGLDLQGQVIEAHEPLQIETPTDPKDAANRTYDVA
jgi:hypothetical protein